MKTIHIVAMGLFALLGSGFFYAVATINTDGYLRDKATTQKNVLSRLNSNTAEYARHRDELTDIKERHDQLRKSVFAGTMLYLFGDPSELRVP